jgi:hypothetical protein
MDELCPVPTDGTYSYVDCDGEVTVPSVGPEFSIVDEFSAFGDPTLDTCSVYIGDPAYEVVDEFIDGCCECPCVPSGTSELTASVSSDGTCGWSGSVTLTLVVPRAAPKDTACWRGTIVGTNGCTLQIDFCCNCNGAKNLQVSVNGPSLCPEGCCEWDGTCSPLLVTGTFCCHWIQGFGGGTIDCGTCCVTVTVSA